jgi:septum formation inhibitor-activating ATPase MinD
MTLRPGTGTPATAPSGRVIFTEGGKGGVGKTAFMTGLVEWFGARQIGVTVVLERK